MLDTSRTTKRITDPERSVHRRTMRNNFLKMKIDDGAVSGEVFLLKEAVKDLKNGFKNLADDSVKLAAAGFGLGTLIVQIIACLAAIYLLVLDRTNWRSNLSTSFLIPYIYLTLPSAIFSLFRGDVGKWLSFIGVAMKLFLHRHYPVTLELFVSLILLVVISPTFIAVTMREGLIGAFISLAIAIYLFSEHVRSAGGLKNAFSRSNGISNSIGIVVLLLYPVWSIVVYFL